LHDATWVLDASKKVLFSEYDNFNLRTFLRIEIYQRVPYLFCPSTTSGTVLTTCVAWCNVTTSTFYPKNVCVLQIRETGTGQQVAQLHDRYMMMMIMICLNTRK